jgi:hypothetical protein
MKKQILKFANHLLSREQIKAVKGGADYGPNTVESGVGVSYTCLGVATYSNGQIAGFDYLYTGSASNCSAAHSNCSSYASGQGYLAIKVGGLSHC